ncbi:MAG: peptidoglycan DD-metalloendopeptidase family protein [Nitrosomonas sp.]|nr:peptidoglycan DD-metalloendopeptidase family protein [Nitrosomonas sp.]
MLKISNVTNKRETLIADAGRQYTASKIVLWLKYFVRRGLLLSVITFYLIGCSTTRTPAPVVDRDKESRSQAATNDLTNQYYIVQKGDTLHSIGATHGIDAKKLAEWNNISDPRMLRVGQKLNLYIPKKDDSQPTLYALPQQPIQNIPESTAQPNVVPLPDTPASGVGAGANTGTVIEQSNIKKTPKAVKLPYSEQNMAQLKRADSQSLSVIAPVTSDAVTSPNTQLSTQQPIEQRNARIEAAPSPDTQKNEKSTHNLSTDWIWPTNGKLLSNFSKNSKGLKISGQSGQPILASASGEVVYSGNGLRGYGNLIIIKHNNTYLSAYAHNSRILVKEGDSVTKGQKIAEMGNTDADSVQLHFEIRKNGKPVDPLIYLPNPS